MSVLLAEFIGSALLIVFGNGVVANVVLEKSKGQHSGWIVIAWGWAIAVFVSVYCVGQISGAHLNPAVSLAMLIAGKMNALTFLQYAGAQLLGCMTGALMVWLIYRDHFKATSDAGLVRACFCTAPAIENSFQNFMTEAISTFVFIIGVLMLTSSSIGLGSLDALPVALLVLGIGLSMGGPTGYAINPARDLGPRIMHALLPISTKGGSQWQYAWVPLAGPLTGASVAAFFHSLLLS